MGLSISKTAALLRFSQFAVFCIVVKIDQAMNWQQSRDLSGLFWSNPALDLWS